MHGCVAMPTTSFQYTVVVFINGTQGRVSAAKTMDFSRGKKGLINKNIHNKSCTKETRYHANGGYF